MDRDEVLLNSLENKKKAYFAMCAVSVLLFVFVFLSDVFSRALSHLLLESVAEVQAALVNIFCFFGAGKTTALMAAKMLLSSAAFSAFVDVLASIVTLVIPGVLFSKAAKLTADECFNIKGRIVKGFVFAFCLVQLFTLTANMFSQSVLDFVLPSNPDLNYSYAEMSDSFDVFGFIMEFVGACVFVPVVEELVFRGILLSYLRRYGNIFGVVASALAFGIAHSSPTQSIYAFVFGVMSAFFVVITGNLKTGVLLHALNNTIMVLSSHLPALIGDETFDIIYCIFMAAVLFISLAGVYMLARKGGYADEFFEKSEGHDSTLVIKPGIKEMLVVPVAAYVILYVVRYLATVFG